MNEISAYYQHPISGRAYRIELKQDLLGDWLLTRYYDNRRKIHVHGSEPKALEQLEIVVKSLLKRGYVELVKKQLSSLKPDFNEPVPLVSVAAEAFTENTDWVDITNCFEMSADEFADANWKRFKGWLFNRYNTHFHDQDVYQFALRVWRGYRESAAL